MSTPANIQTASEPAVACTDWFGMVESRLSPREMEVARLLDAELSIEEISLRLGRRRGEIMRFKRQIAYKYLRAKEDLAIKEKLAELKAGLFPNESGQAQTPDGNASKRKET